MKKTIALFMMFFVIVTSLNIAYCADKMHEIGMDIYVNASGDAHVIETWKYHVEDSGKKTENYHPYYNLGTSTIKNLKVEDEDGIEYENIGGWNVDSSFTDKKYKCGINEIQDGIEICWGISEFGDKEYEISYDITNFVSGLNDAQMLYWTLIPHDFSVRIEKVDITIRTEQKFEDTIDVWGYGAYGDYCYVADGVIKFVTEDALDSNEYITILAKFPQGMFDTQNKINADFSSFFGKAEEREYSLCE